MKTSKLIEDKFVFATLLQVASGKALKMSIRTDEMIAICHSHQDLKARVSELRDALTAVVRVADRDTDDFAKARAALQRAEGEGQ